MIATGSGLERFMNCLGAGVLPRAFDEGGNPDSTRGKEAHAYLQRISDALAGGEKLDQAAAASLELVDERFRDACSAIDLDDLRDAIELTAEITLAYNPAFDTARVLGVGLERQYDAAGCTEDEIPLTLDVAGLNGPPGSASVGVITDYKFGFWRPTSTERNWQMRGGALALARAFDLDEVRSQLIHMREGAAARRDRAVFAAGDLAAIAGQVRARWEVVLRARDRFERERVEPDVTQGPWCDYCPSYFRCGAKVALVRATVAGDELDDLTRSSPLAHDMLAVAFRRLRDVKDVLKRIEAMIYAGAHERPVLLETLDDGTQLWLGLTPVLGQTQVDGDKARQVVREMLDAEAVEEVSMYEVTLGRIEAAIKKREPRGKGAAKLRAVRAELEKRGALKRPSRHDVAVYKIKPGQLAAGKAAAP